MHGNPVARLTGNLIGFYADAERERQREKKRERERENSKNTKIILIYGKRNAKRDMTRSSAIIMPRVYNGINKHLRIAIETRGKMFSYVIPIAILYREQ